MKTQVIYGCLEGCLPNRFLGRTIHSTSTLLLTVALLSILANIHCQKSDANTGPAKTNADITLLSPRGGEKVKVGDTLWIKWEVKDDPVNPITSVDFRISPDSGKTWELILDKVIPVGSVYWKKFPWVVEAKTLGVPGVSLISSACFFRVEDYGATDSSKMATTRSTFTISNP